MSMNRWMWTLVLAPLLAGPATAAPAKDDQADAQAILDKAIKALGGEEKLAKLTSFVETAKVKSKLGNGKDWECTRTISHHFPGRWRIEMNGFNGQEDFSSLFVLDGDQGWSFNSGNPYEFTKDQISSHRQAWTDELVVWQFLFFRDKDHKLSPLGACKVGDQAAVGVKASRKGDADIKLYFDRDTGLLLKREREEVQPAPSGEKPPPPIAEEILYENYKEVGGIKYPSKKTSRRDKQITSEEEVIEFKIVEKFDEKTFAKPEKK